MNDPIVDEVRKIRDDHAKQFGYDLDAIYQDIKRRERESGLKFVDGQARPGSSDGASMRQKEGTAALRS